MRLLLIAYEFPPVESAQGLRWGYLARALAARGHRIDVLTARLSDAAHPLARVPGVIVHPVFAGPFVGGAAALARRWRGAGGGASSAAASGRAAVSERVYRGLRRGLDQVLVPDVRTEWLPWARAAARRLCAAQRPDAVIASHEPGVDLALAAGLARTHRLPWLADLGDPMLSVYAPRWRRWLEARFERRWLGSVGAWCVTTGGAQALLERRLPWLAQRPSDVVSQGYDPQPSTVAESPVDFSAERLELLFTGTLYAAFRDPSALVEALAAVPRARLTVIGALDGIDPLRFASHPQVRYLGRLGHDAVRAAQRAADVLVNIGNRDDSQMPGKVFEYLGSGRPVLHLAQSEGDPTAHWLRTHAAGLVAPLRADAIAALLARLAADPGSVLPARTAALDRAVQAHSWPALAARVEALLLQLVDRGA